MSAHDVMLFIGLVSLPPYLLAALVILTNRRCRR